MNSFVCFHIAKKLKQAGVPQNSLFYYNRSGERFFHENIFVGSKDFNQLWTSAFTTDELFPYVEKYLKKNRDFDFKVTCNVRMMKGGLCRQATISKTADHIVEAESFANLTAKIVLKISKEVL